MLRPHRRWNPLTREWILVSPHRAQRPWLGQMETVTEDRPAYDPRLHALPGEQARQRRAKPRYADTYVFDNDFPSLLTPCEKEVGDIEGTLFRSREVSGECRVICFSPTTTSRSRR